MLWVTTFARNITIADVLEYLEFTQLSNRQLLRLRLFLVLEYLEFTQLSNRQWRHLLRLRVLEYLEFTQLSNFLMRR